MSTRHFVAFDPNLWQAAHHALASAVTLFGDDANTTHIDLGYRVRSSQGYRFEPELAVRVHVRQKLAGEDFEILRRREPQRVISAARVGFPVDVLPARYRLQRGECQTATRQHAAFHEVLRGGLAIAPGGSLNCGTLGGSVRDRRTGEAMLMSSWHALASSGQTRPGALIYQPVAPPDANSKTAIAIFARGAMHASLDAAVARYCGTRALSREQYGLGYVTGTAPAYLGMRVIKSGAGSGVTRGVVTGLAGYTWQRYSGVQRLLRHTLHISPEDPGTVLCAPGDSGSWWMEAETLRVVGSHFAGSTQPQFGLAQAMPEILEALAVEVEAAPETAPRYLFSAGESAAARASSVQVSVVREDVSAAACTPKPEPPLNAQVQRAGALNFAGQLYKLGAKLSGMGASLWRDFFWDWRKMVMWAGLLAFWALSGAAADAYLDYGTTARQQSLTALQSPYQALRATAQRDSVRRADLARILTIIERYNAAMPTDLKLRIAEEIQKLSLKYPNLDIALICATITHETGRTWNPRSVSWAGALGLMQIMPATGRHLAQAEGMEWMGAENTLFDPFLNIRLGCRYLSELVEAYSIDGGLAAYNGGERRAARWLKAGRRENILAQETRAYVPAILKIYDDFRQ